MIPVSGRTAPPLRLQFFGRFIDDLSLREDRTVFTEVSRPRGHEFDPAVKVFVVIPSGETLCPRKALKKAGKWLRWKHGAILGRLE